MLYITRLGSVALFLSIASLAGGLALGDWILYFTGLLGVLATIHSYNAARRIDGALHRVQVWRREHELRGYDGAEAKIRFIVENRSSEDLALAIQDHPPERVAQHPGKARIHMPSPQGSRREAWYTVRPRLGSYEWSLVEVSSTAPLGLFIAAVQLNLPAKLHVAPTPGPMGYRIRHLPLGSGQPMKIPSRAGLEFLSLRMYVEGDDPRMIHWPSTARLGEFIVRENASESRLKLALLLDYSLEMWLGTPGMAAIDHAARLVAGLAGEALAAGSTLTLALFDGARCSVEELTRVGHGVIASRLSRISGRNLRLQDRFVECLRLLSAHTPGSVLVAATGPGLDWGSLGNLPSLLAPIHPVRVVAVALPTGGMVEERLVRAYEASALEGASRALYPGVVLVYGGFEDLSMGVLGVVRLWSGGW